MTIAPMQDSQAVFFDPAKEREAKRKRAMAEMLIEQGNTPLKNETAGGMTVARSPWENIAQGAQKAYGEYQIGKADQMDTETDRARSRLYEEALLNLDGDPKAAARVLMQDPSLSGAALQMYQQALSDERGIARDDAKFEREAGLKRELAAMRSGASMEIDPETGQMVFLPAQQQYSMPNQSQMAQQYGVPARPLDVRGMMEKDQSRFALNTRQRAQDRLNDQDFVTAAKKAREQQQLAAEFEQLMEQQKTGGWAAVPLVGDAMRMFDPELRRMQSIQDTLTPGQREPGSGATSDFDAKMFQSGIFGPTAPPETNKAILAAKKAQAQDSLNYQTFLSDYLAANGHLNGADASWQEYVDNNPIFDPSAGGKPVLNPARKSYQEYFRGAQGARPLPQAGGGQADSIRQRLRQLGADPARIEAYIKTRGIQ